MSRRAKRDVIVIDDDDAKIGQPAEKIIKKEQEPAVPPNAAELQQKLLEKEEKLAKWEQKFKRVCEMAGEHKTRVEFLENLIDQKGKVKEESMDEKVIDLTKQLEAEWDARTRDSERIAQLTNQLEEERIGREDTVNALRNRNSELTNQLDEERRARLEDNEKIAQLGNQLEEERRVGINREDTVNELRNINIELTNQLEEERIGREDTVNELRNRNSELTNQLEEERIGREDTVNELRNRNSELTNQLEEERRARMEDRVKFEQQQTPAVVMEPLPNEADLTHDETQEESLFEAEMDFIEDPIINDRDSTPIEEHSLNYLLPSGENVEELAQTEIIEDAIDSMEEEVDKDGSVHDGSDIQKNYSETGKVENKKRPSRTSSKQVKYVEFLDESEPVEKKPRIKSEKEIDNKTRSVVDESSSKQSIKGVRVSKINQTELECPNCEYRSRSVPGWYMHINRIHSTNPLELGLALLCDCGHESFTDAHSRQCESSKITIVRKNPTPQCVMCEFHPKTVGGYAQHLVIHHKTTLKQMGMFLICSCGYKVCSHHADPEHTKKCNGHEYSAHKLDDE